ncbi:MAG: hypothetical protein WDZ91_11395 [Paenibacillaceae bacterium]
MIHYLKLVHYELTRFRFIYASLFVLTLLSQLGGVYFYAHSIMNRINDTMVRESMSDAAYVSKYGTVGFLDFTGISLWFMAPIALCITALVLYVFLIWYRDWMGKNMFIYRLLMLPTARANIYLAKLSTIFLMVLGLIAFQLLVLPLLNSLYNSLVPSIFRYTMPIFDLITIHPLLNILIPQNFVEFVLYYGAGIMGVIIIFTAILIERSHRWKGIIAGIAYVVVASLVFFLPIFLSEIWFINYFYPIEIVLMEIVTGILVIIASLWLSFFLLKNKVYV